MPPLGNFSIAAIVLAVALIAAVACFSAAPSECIAAAEDAGLSESVIEQLRNPDDLSAVERAALNRTLSRAGIDDVCAAASESSDIPADTGQSNPDATAEAAPDNPPPVRQTATAQRSARIPSDDEHRRRCQFWALHSMEPVVYNEFTKLNPDNMDDLDRILWRQALNPEETLGYYDDELAGGEEIPPLLPLPGIHCRDYWAEPLNRSNADLRNHAFESYCRMELELYIVNEYQHLAQAASYPEQYGGDDSLIYKTPNQYVRVLQWLDLSGDDLRNSDNPPYRILMEQSRHPYSHFERRIPTETFLAEYRQATDTQLDLEWLGILVAAGLSSESSGLGACHYYYPQVFYGYWVPFDTHLAAGQQQDIDLLGYAADTHPLYLPESVTAEQVRVGYPLGLVDERYHLCLDNSQMEQIGYYYVAHPAGDYCERIP